MALGVCSREDSVRAGRSDNAMLAPEHINR